MEGIPLENMGDILLGLGVATSIIIALLNNWIGHTK